MSSRCERFVVHIGGHKCGSTAIQEYCALNQDELLSKGVHYPANLFSGYPMQHSALASYLAEGNSSYLEDVFFEVVRYANMQGASTVFMSGEELCKSSPDSVKMLTNLVEKYFDSWKFVFVERNAKEFLLSSYKHHLRYAPTLSETAFSREIIGFSPKAAIEIWREFFTLDGLFIHYDQIKENILPTFFKTALGIEIRTTYHANESLDYLFLQIINTFLKEWPSEKIENIIWDVTQRHPDKMTFSVEDCIADDIRSLLLEDEWRPVEFRGDRSLLGDVGKVRAKGHNPVAVCNKMLDLFGTLRTHFLEIGNNDDEDIDAIKQQPSNQ